MVEVATIGREGIAGVSAVLHDGPSPSATMVQAESDTCYRLPAQTFREAVDRDGHLARLLTRYTHAQMLAVMQSTACNAVHSVERRLSRWLLQAHDRIGRDQFPLTQEFVAMMLGATRPTVTIAARTLQKAGLISYHRGQLTIVNRAGLEAASCECYQVTRRLVNQMYAEGPQGGR